MKLYTPGFDEEKLVTGKKTPKMNRDENGSYLKRSTHLKKLGKAGIKNSYAPSYHLVLNISGNRESAAYTVTTSISEYGEWVLLSDHKKSFVGASSYSGCSVI